MRINESDLSRFASIRINSFVNVSGLRMSMFVIVGERQRICCSSDFLTCQKFTDAFIHRIYFCASVRFNTLIDSQVYVSYTFEYARERFRLLIYIFDTKNLHTRCRDANYVRSIALWCALLRCLGNRLWFCVLCRKLSTVWSSDAEQFNHEGR